MDKAAPWGPHLLLDSRHLVLVEAPSPFHAAHMNIPSSREDPGGPSGLVSHSPALAFSSLFICGSWEFIQHFYVIRGRRRTFHVESVHIFFFLLNCYWSIVPLHVPHINWTSWLILSLRSTQNLRAFHMAYYQG